MFKVLSMAALLIVSVTFVACSGDNDIIDNPQQPENTSNVVTLTTTVGFDDGAQTRALTSAGVKTFAEGETMAIVYKNTSDETVKAVSAPLTAADIAEGSQSATFTFGLTNPDKAQDVTYIYPAAMANDEGEVNYNALDEQDGTLSTLASNLDLAIYTGAWDSESLPSGTLENQLAILALTLKNETGSDDITSSITSLTIKEGSNTYTVTRSAAAGPICVAIRPTDEADITVTANDGSTDYSKFLQSKTYEANNGYSLTWKMIVPTLAKTLTTAGMAVNVWYNYRHEVNNCLYVSNGDGTYTFLSGSGYEGGGNNTCAKALVVEGGKLVFKQNLYETIETYWSEYGYAITFNTSDKSYSEEMGSSVADSYFIRLEVNGKETIAHKITVDDLEKNQGETWEHIAESNNKMIYSDGYTIRRISDNASLIYNYSGDYWSSVRLDDEYDPGTTYKFEGD